MSHCFPGQSPSAADDLQRSLREAAGVSAADRTVTSATAPPKESLHHRPSLPLPVHQKEDLVVTAWKKTTAILDFWMEKNLKYRCKHGCISIVLCEFETLFLGVGGGFAAILPRQLSAAVCQPMRPLQFCVCTKLVLVCLLSSLCQRPACTSAPLTTQQYLCLCIHGSFFFVFC